MKAIIYQEYGTPDVLRLAEVEKPVPKCDEVLIRVRAAEATKSDHRIENDVIFDMVAASPYAACINALTENGRYLSCNPRLSAVAAH